MMTRSFFTLSILAFFSPNFGFCQPSTSTVKAVVKNKCVNKPGNLLSIEVSTGGNQKELQGGVMAYYHDRSYTLTFKTPYSNIKHVVEGTIMFKKKTGDYEYMNHSKNKGYYTGIPNPNESQINTALNEIDIYEIFVPDNYAISVDSKISVHPETDWLWTGYNEVGCLIQYKYTALIGQIKKQYLVKRWVTLKRSVNGNVHDQNSGPLSTGKWLNVKESDIIIATDTGGRPGEKKELLSETTISSKEARTILTLKQKRAEKDTKEMLAKLPVIDIPKFQYENQARQFVHELLIEGDTNKIKAVIYAMMPNPEIGYNYTEEWSSFVLTVHGQSLLSKALTNIHLYKEKYCKQPVYRRKKDSFGYLGKPLFWDKHMKSTLNIAVFEKNGKWYLTTLGFHLSEKDLKEYQNENNVQCGSPSFFLNESDAQFKVGDRVKVQVDGKTAWKTASVTEIILSDGLYKVKVGNDRNARTWKVSEDFIKYDTDAVSGGNNSDPATTNASGDDKTTDQGKTPANKKKKKIRVKIGGLKIGG